MAQDTVLDVSGEMEPIKQQNEATKFFTSLANYQIQVPHMNEWVAQRRQNVKPWLTFAQTSNFKAPQSIPRLSRRIIRNIEYFQSNYLCILIVLSLYCLITSPLLLIAVGVHTFCQYKLSRRPSQSIKIFGRELSSKQQHLVVSACFIPVFYVVGAGSALFWTMGAFLIIVSLHAVFYNIDAIIAEPEDSFGLTQEV